MILYSWNVNGFRSIVKKGFFDQIKSWNADIICLQEVKLNEYELDKKIEWDPLIKDQYNIYWHNGSMLGYSGVAIFSKKKPEKVSFQFEKEISFFSKEGRIIELDFNNWVLLNIYFPNGNSRKIEKNVLKYKLLFYESFLDHIESLRKRGKSIISCGDYNIAHKEKDLAHPKENMNSIGFLPEERIYLDRLIELGYIDVFRYFYPNLESSYTWWSYIRKSRSKNIGWRIDYFFVNLELKSKLLEIDHKQDILGSDHCPVYMNIDI